MGVHTASGCRKVRRTGWLGIVFGVLFTGLAGVTWATPGDPLERVNRGVFWVNDKADRLAIRPIAKGYENTVPAPARRGIHNLFQNLGEPGTAVNQFLQGKPRQGISDLGRFLVNSTVGLFGLFDVASKHGMPRHDENFAQTFAVWGIPSGPFIMVPALGPSTVTDTVGDVFDFFTNPISLISPDRDRYIVVGVRLIDVRAQLLAVDGLITGDPYIFVRDAFLQRREFMIRDGIIEDDPFFDEYDDYDDEAYEDEEF